MIPTINLLSKRFYVSLLHHLLDRHILDAMQKHVEEFVQKHVEDSYGHES